MRNVLDKSCRENQNTQFVSNDYFSENRAIYEIMSKNVVEPEAKNGVTVWCIRVTCWISRTTRTNARARRNM
jgi:hypothetical protein